MLMCLNSERGNDMQVVVGRLSLDTDEPTGQIINVEEAIVHENYRETLVSVHNDIGEHFDVNCRLYQIPVVCT